MTDNITAAMVAFTEPAKPADEAAVATAIVVAPVPTEAEAPLAASSIIARMTNWLTRIERS